MDSQPSMGDEVKSRSRATNWIATAVGGAFGIAGAGFAVAAFALRTHRLVLSSRTLSAILGALFLYAMMMTALVRRLARGGPSATPKPTPPNEADGLTRRVRLLRGTDDL